MKKAPVLLLIALNLLLLVSFAHAGKEKALPEKLPVPGMVTLIDLGAATCIPCKMMAPILTELEEEYKGKAAVVFIDLRFHKELAREYKVKSIPTQILYDRSGNEVARHVGFLSKKAIDDAFKQLGVTK